MAREFIVPGEIISGSGALDMAEGALKLLGKSNDRPGKLCKS